MASPYNISAEEVKPHDIEASPYSLGQRAQRDLGLEIKPVYKQIKAVYVNMDGDDSQQVSQNDIEKYGFFVMSAIGKGEPVTKGDITEMRQAQMNAWMPRSHMWALRRQVANFIGLNMCNLLVLVLLTILSFMMYQNNNNDCPNYSKVTLFYTILSGIWALTTLMGIHAANKRIVKNLRYFIMITILLMVLMVIATAYGLLDRDHTDSCNGDSSQTFFMVAVGVFSLLDVGFFAVLAKKLRELLMREENNQRRRMNRNRNNNADNAQNRANGADRANRDSLNRQRNGGNRSARGASAPYRV